MAENIDAERERAAFITAYRLWAYEAHPNAHPEMVQFQAESHWGRAAGAMWLAARCTPSASIGEDGLPVEVKIERGRVWIVRGNQSFMLAYVPDEGDDPAEMQAYADNLRSALSGFTPCVNSAVQGAASPQAAEGVKTWQERYEEDGHAESGEFYMQDEIDDLRAQITEWNRLLRASVPARWKDCTSPVGSVQSYIAELEDLVAAPPLSSEQQTGRKTSIESTHEMNRAGRDALRACGNDQATDRDAALCWSAMIVRRELPESGME